MTTGIYKIVNKVNNNIYIGSAVNIEDRQRGHISKLNNNKHENGHLQNAWNKYGADAFRFSVVEKCNIFLLINREQYYIDKLKPQYNIYKTAGSPLGIKQSEETKRKVSLAGKGRIFSKLHRVRLSLAAKGRQFTDEHKKNISLSKIGKKMSKDFRENVSKRLKGNKHALGNKFHLTQEQIEKWRLSMKRNKKK